MPPVCIAEDARLYNSSLDQLSAGASDCEVDRGPMERRDQFVVILGLVALLSASAVALPTQRAGKDEEPASPCDPILLAGMAASCVGNLVKPSEVCCEMVIASVGFGYGGTDPVPCLCRVVKEHEFMATGLSADMIVKMYRVCDGVLPVDPFMGHVCR